MIEFTCECGRRFAVKEEHAGGKTRCIDCKRVLTIPTGAGPKVSTDAASRHIAKSGSLMDVAQKALDADRAAALAAEKRSPRDYMYLVFLLSMAPLAIATFQPH